MQVKKVAARAAVALLAVLLALVILEVLVRSCWAGAEGGYPAGLFVADDACGYRLRPGFSAPQVTPEFAIRIVTDDRGYRVAAAAAEPAAARVAALRVAALGDSFCFGHGVEAEEAYPAALQRALVDRGRDAVVVNTGAPGYGTHNALALLEADADALAPDVAVLGLYLGNDFRDNDVARFGRLIGRSGILVTQEAGDGTAWLSVKAALAVHWRSLQLLMLGLGEPARTDAEVERQFCEDLEWSPSFGAAMVRRERSADARRAFDATVARLDELAAFCAGRGVRLLVALLPAPYQYHRALWNIVVDRCGLTRGAFDMARPGRELVAWGERRGVAVVDLLPAFRAATLERGQHLYLDVHFNAAGHRLAATEIAAAFDRATVPPAR